MPFEQHQIRKLRAKLNRRHVKAREADGQTLHYVEGWHVVAEANRIFGFDGWDRMTLASDCVWTKQQGQRYCAAYVARVRISVRAGDTTIVREGSGVGESNAATPGQAHDFAAKAAETDATKRALMTFGNAFGLSLYGGSTNDATSRPRGGLDRDHAELPPTGTAGNNEKRGVETEQTNDNRRQGDHSPDEIFPGDRPEPGFRSIDKSLLALSEPRRIRDAEHLRLVAGKPCIICGRMPSEAHHLRFAQPRAMGRKVSDEFTVPLCATHHRQLHARGDEEAWWRERNCDPIGVASELWQSSRLRHRNDEPAI